MLPQLLLAALTTPAQAAEVSWHGHYRGRALIFNSLSLTDEDGNSNSEGLSAWTDHRLRLQPSVLVNSKVAVHFQLDAFPLGYWGDSANAFYDPVTDDLIPTAYADGVAPYADSEDGTSYLRNLQMVRGWAEVQTPIGRLSFGRMPLHWGTGILYNDGLSAESEFGDTSDRVQLLSQVGPVWVLGAWETLDEGFRSVGDDLQALDLAVYYRSETLGVGVYNRLRYQDLGQTFRSYTGDAYAFAALGPARVEAEVVAVFGSGDLDTGANDISISSVGAVLQGTVELEKIYGGAELGWANGDGDPTDSDLHTFSFDRDHNPTLMLFEEPLPTLEPAVLNDTNQGVDYSAVRTGEGISNALYGQAFVGYKLRPDLRGDVGVFVARQALPSPTEESRRFYGTEVDLNLRYQPFEHFYLKGTGALLLPGAYFSAYEDSELGGGFAGPALGGRLYATVEF